MKEIHKKKLKEEQGARFTRFHLTKGRECNLIKR